MIELRPGTAILKVIRIVAGIARASKLSFLEGTTVGIGVAALAATEGQAFIPRGRLAGRRSVALLAGDLLMQSRERVARAGMTESRSGLEGVLRMAVEAIGPELALMLILMTGSALTAKAKKRPVQILQLDLAARAG